MLNTCDFLTDSLGKVPDDQGSTNWTSCALAATPTSRPSFLKNLQYSQCLIGCGLHNEHTQRLMDQSLRNDAWGVIIQ